MADITPHEDRQNKRAIREMFRDAFERLGGVDWLVTFANRSDENARVFVNSITKMIPLELTGKDGQPLTIQVITEPLAAPEPQVLQEPIEGESRVLQ
jgi:hypothetical protein